MSIRLCAIDIDGTLVNSQLQLTPYVKETIQNKIKQGVKIVLCTGRPYTGVQHLQKELGITGSDNYVITYNGAAIQDADQNVLKEHRLSFEDFLKIEKTSLDLNIPMHIHALNPPRIIALDKDLPHYSVLEAALTNIPLHYREKAEISPDEEIVKLMYIAPPHELKKALLHFPTHYYNEYTCVRSADFFFEILNKNASKGQALKELTELLGLKKEETMAIGDNENDLSMIQQAGIGVAMGNAIDLIKPHAQFITKSNDEDGVAYALNHFIP